MDARVRHDIAGRRQDDRDDNNRSELLEHPSPAGRLPATGSVLESPFRALPRQDSDREERPWGSFETVDKGDRYRVKRIVVKPGEQLSLQMHYHRAEHWVIVSGAAIVTRGETRQLARENEAIFIPVGVRHRIENPGKTPLCLVEVQVGSYLEEDDIVRFEDRYGRS